MNPFEDPIWELKPWAYQAPKKDRGPDGQIVLAMSGFFPHPIVHQYLLSAFEARLIIAELKKQLEPRAQFEER